MARYDQEDLLDDLLAICKARLNTRLAAIEAEKVAKGKGVAGGLAPVSDSVGYIEQTLDIAAKNVSPLIFYGIEDLAAADGGGVTAVTYKVFFEVLLVEDRSKSDGFRRIARYARALKEIFEEAATAASLPGSLIKVETVRPIAFKLEEDASEETKVGGVSLSIALI